MDPRTGPFDGVNDASRVDDDDELGDDGVQRPLPPPPSLGELWDVFRQRIALRYPRFDPTRLLLAAAALIGLGGMAWAMWAPRHEPPAPAPVRTVVSSTTTIPAVTTTTLPAEFVVDVAGAVNRPGPVRVHREGRVDDAIRAAGGVRDDADLERVDRAAQLADGQRIYVPAVGQTEIPQVVGATGQAPRDQAAQGGQPDGASGSPGVPAGPVNVNTADEAELTTLPGVGPATAQAIIEHRGAHGPFASVDDLLDVRGIGPAKMATLRSLVTV